MVLPKGTTFPTYTWSFTCRGCGKRFTYKAKRKGQVTSCKPCAKLRKQGATDIHLVAKDAKPGESLEDYLDRMDRKVWNL